MAGEGGGAPGPGGLNPGAVNVTGDSGFGVFNSVSPARSLVQRLRTALCFGNLPLPPPPPPHLREPRPQNTLVLALFLYLGLGARERVYGTGARQVSEVPRLHSCL